MSKNAQGSMAAIADGAMMPIQKTPLKVMSRSDQMAGMLLAANVLAYNQTVAYGWADFGRELMAMTVEQREAFINAVKAELKEAKKEAVEAGDDSKAAGKNLSANTVQVSRMTTIGKAFNAGGTVEGLMDFWNQETKAAKGKSLADVPFITMYNYARMFTGSKAVNKPEPGFQQAMAKWLATQAKQEWSDSDAAFLEQTINFFNGLEFPTAI